MKFRPRFLQSSMSGFRAGVQPTIGMMSSGTSSSSFSLVLTTLPPFLTMALPTRSNSFCLKADKPGGTKNAVLPGSITANAL